MAVVFSLIAVVTAGLAAAGGMVESQEEAKPSFTGEYSVASDGRIAYVMESSGTQTLYVKERGAERSGIYTAEESKKLWSPAFNENGDVSVIETTGYPEGGPGEQEFQLAHSDVLRVSAEGGKKETVLQARGVLTVLKKDPAHERLIVKGIHVSTQGKPEEGFKPMESGLYTLKPDGAFEEIRTFDTYSPGSLSISSDGSKMLMILPDDYKNATPESMFESVQRIYEMNIAEPGQLSLVPLKHNDIPVSEVVQLEKENKLLVQTIMNYGEGDPLFQYDMVTFDRAAGEKGERLGINESVQHAQLNQGESGMYYIKEKDRQTQQQRYELYHYHLESGEEEKIELTPQSS
ncbi:hypothetical protein [Salibacterium halotolerans]|uniref:Uncharacterized protein n=1 Tax=Salibacterium halotolerans TaxID=1884432 RepID=A0A1I5XCJ0_9BACI|nr:hypothetical protein [Salibacterium halotolerans]SFQ29367.1 hypothetical protein SAMN05518683_12642 [Salibacterium halotolerans]